MGLRRGIYRDNCCSLLERAPLDLSDTFHAAQPRNAILRELLYLRLQLRLRQIEIIHRADAQGAIARPTRASPVHEQTAGGTEVVRHRMAVAWANGT